METLTIDPRRSRPTAKADGAQFQGIRGDRYGGLLASVLGDAKASLADERSYFSATSPTPGTGIAQSIQTSFLATNGALMIRHGANATTRLFLDYIRLINTVVGASGTRSEGLIAIDNLDRFSSGGTTLTAVGRNMDEGGVSQTARVQAGAITLAVESIGVRRLSRFQLRTVIMVQYEEWLLKFGGAEGIASESIAAAVAIRNMIPLAPVVLGAGHSVVLHLWHPGNAVTAPSWEFEVGWWER